MKIDGKRLALVVGIILVFIFPPLIVGNCLSPETISAAIQAGAPSSLYIIGLATCVVWLLPIELVGLVIVLIVAGAIWIFNWVTHGSK
jgi:hypothetical protein